jgi:hypothetical protein
MMSFRRLTRIQWTLLVVVSALLMPLRTVAQPPPKPTAGPAAAARVKVLLLGSVHFTPSKTDVYKNAALDLLSAQRQPQVQQVVEKLAAFKPDQICVEWPALKQRRLDSLYQAYLTGKYSLESDEFDQFAMRTARRLNLPGLTAVNYAGNFDMDPVTNYAKAHQQAAVLAELDQTSATIIARLDQQAQALPLDQFLEYVNSPVALAANAGFYAQVLRIGGGADYPGVDLVSDWYTTNLHIYANILRRVRPTDNVLLLIYGQGHIPILKSLFAADPNFEVVEVRDVL